MNTKNAIFGLIFSEGPLLREKVVSKSGIGRVTVGKIIRELLEEGKIIEDGKLSTGRGRAKRLLRVNPELYYVLTVFYSGHQFTGGVVNLDKTLIYECSSRARENSNAFAAEIISFINEVQKGAGINESKILGIGVALPGSFDIKRGKLLGVRGIKQWKELLLQDILKDKFRKEVFLVDDTDVLEWMEYEAREKEGIKNLLYVYLGEGIGLGTVLNGRLYSGSNGNAGEIGHLVVGENGKRCYCGNYGCLETFSSLNSIIEYVKKGIKEGVHSIAERVVDGDLDRIDIEAISLSLEEGDKLCRDAIEKAAEYIGKATAVLVNVFNPEMIVLGGPLTETGNILLSAVEARVKRESSPVSLRGLKIEFSKTGEARIATGAALPLLDMMRVKKWKDWQ